MQLCGKETMQVIMLKKEKKICIMVLFQVLQFCFDCIPSVESHRAKNERGRAGTSIVSYR